MIEDMYLLLEYLDLGWGGGQICVPNVEKRVAKKI